MQIELKGKGVICDVYFIDAGEFEHMQEQARIHHAIAGSEDDGPLLLSHHLLATYCDEHIRVSKGFFLDDSQLTCSFLFDDTALKLVAGDHQAWAAIKGSDNSFVTDYDYDGLCETPFDNGTKEPAENHLCVLVYTDVEDGSVTLEAEIPEGESIESLTFICNPVDCGGAIGEMTYQQGIVGAETTNEGEYAILGVQVGSSVLDISLPTCEDATTRIQIFSYNEDSSTHEFDWALSKTVACEQAEESEQPSDSEIEQYLWDDEEVTVSAQQIESIHRKIDRPLNDELSEDKLELILADHKVGDEAALRATLGDNYVPYSDRVPMELHNFSRLLTAEANARYRCPLKAFINEHCEHTANRGFDDVYIDARAYVDPRNANNLLVSFAILVRVPDDDHFDTLATRMLNDTLEPLNPLAKDEQTFGQTWSLDELGAALVEELLSRHFDYVTSAAGLELSPAGLINFEVNRGIYSLIHGRFAAAAESLDRHDSASGLDIEASVSKCIELLPRIRTQADTKDAKLRAQLIGALIALGEVYRQAFGKGSTDQRWVESTSLDEAFALDVGCCQIFKREMLACLVQIITGSRSLTFGMLADEILEEINVSLEFAEDDGEPLSEDRLFGNAEAYLIQQLPLIERVFCSDIRWEINAFKEHAEQIQDVDILSPWYWMSPQLRLHPDFLSVGQDNGLLVMGDMAGFPRGTHRPTGGDIPVRTDFFSDS